MKLKFHLQKLEKRLVFQILEQSNVNNDDLAKISFNIKHTNYVSSTKVFFHSYGTPQITIGSYCYLESSCRNLVTDYSDVIEIYLRGKSKNRNNDVITIPFKDNKLRDSYYEIIITSLKKLCKHV